MRYIRSFTLLALSLALLASLMGCGSSPSVPDADPDITGTVSGLTSTDAAATGSFLVTGSGQFDKASVSVTEDATILLDDGGPKLREVDFSEIRNGDTVRVWTTGMVRESYPVQVDAATIVIDGEAR